MVAWQDVQAMVGSAEALSWTLLWDLEATVGCTAPDEQTSSWMLLHVMCGSGPDDVQRIYQGAILPNPLHDPLADPWARRNTHQQHMTGRLPGSPHRGRSGPAQRA